MATRIRLARFGSKRRPVYRVVVCDDRAKRDGRFIEKLGWYDPRHIEKEDLIMDLERVDYWLGVGASPSDRAALLIKRARKELTN